MSQSLVLVLLCACLAVGATASEDDHGHGDAGFEWAGIFELPEVVYMWTAQKVKGQYADATMKMAVLPAAQATAEALGALESEGKHSLEANCTPLSPGGVIIPKEDACYQLQFDNDLWQSLYTVNMSNVAAAAFFTEHVPTEFESTAHYLKDGSGEDIEPVAELPVAKDEEEHVEWGSSIVSAILVNLITLVGAILAVPVFTRAVASYKNAFEGIVSAFAAGALLACAFFLLLFEATHLVGEGWDGEVEVLWRWGTLTLSGFLLPFFIDSLSAFVLGEKTDGVSEVVVGESQPAPADGDAPKSNLGRVRVIAAVVIGDFFHNLCDGFFIGAAFKGCGASFGWGVALSTILHEIPQELADYMILTGDGVNLSAVHALVVNFGVGMSVLLGVIIINLSDVSNAAIGLLLAFGGGVYIYIAAVECMPKVISLRLPATMNFACVMSFILGTILIGLILLDHEHCVPGGGEHSHGH